MLTKVVKVESFSCNGGTSITVSLKPINRWRDIEKNYRKACHCICTIENIGAIPVTEWEIICIFPKDWELIDNWNGQFFLDKEKGLLIIRNVHYNGLIERQQKINDVGFIVLDNDGIKEDVIGVKTDIEIVDGGSHE
jgi:hypothetical protein